MPGTKTDTVIELEVAVYPYTWTVYGYKEVPTGSYSKAFRKPTPIVESNTSSDPWVASSFLFSNRYSWIVIVAVETGGSTTPRRRRIYLSSPFRISSRRLSINVCSNQGEESRISFSSTRLISFSNIVLPNLPYRSHALSYVNVIRSLTSQSSQIDLLHPATCYPHIFYTEAKGHARAKGGTRLLIYSSKSCVTPTKYIRLWKEEENKAQFSVFLLFFYFYFYHRFVVFFFISFLFKSRYVGHRRGHVDIDR